MFQSVLRASRRLPRKSLWSAQLRQTASKAAATVVSQDSGHNSLVWGGVLAAAAATAVVAWDQQNKQKATDCCGIIGVVAHPKFDVR